LLPAQPSGAQVVAPKSEDPPNEKKADVPTARDAREQEIKALRDRLRELEAERARNALVALGEVANEKAKAELDRAVATLRELARQLAQKRRELAILEAKYKELIHHVHRLPGGKSATEWLDMRGVEGRPTAEKARPDAYEPVRPIERDVGVPANKKRPSDYPQRGAYPSPKTEINADFTRPPRRAYPSDRPDVGPGGGRAAPDLERQLQQLQQQLDQIRRELDRRHSGDRRKEGK